MNIQWMVYCTAGIQKQEVEEPRIILGFFSTAREKDKIWRQVHRETHFQYSNVCPHCPILSRFILGQPATQDERIALERENQTYGDLILLPIPENMNEGKTYHWWKYAAEHFSTAKYVAKADTDSYVWMHALEQDLERFNGRQSIYYGRMSCGHRVGCKGNQRFISGGFQVMSIDLVHWIADPLNSFVQERIKGYEDLITGEWLHIGHRFAHLESPCPDQVEDMYRIYQTDTCGDVFMHWLKDPQDFRELWQGRLRQLRQRKEKV